MTSKLNAGLEYLKETKELIREALISQGVDISDSDPFRSYAEKVASISGGTTVGTFTYGASEYFSIEPDSSCWTKADDTFISNAKYYDWLEKIQSGALSAEGVSVKLNTETYSEYDFVINPTDRTLKLPTLNGGEVINSDYSVDDLGFPVSPTTTNSDYVVPCNGYLFVNAYKSTTGGTLSMNLNGIPVNQTRGYTAESFNVFFFVKRGDIVSIFADNNNKNWTILYQKLFKARGNGSLYYYTGATENTLSEDIEELKSQVGDISAILDYTNGEVV